jgi:hypothetical protein
MVLYGVVGMVLYGVVDGVVDGVVWCCLVLYGTV